MKLSEVFSQLNSQQEQYLKWGIALIMVFIIYAILRIIQRVLVRKGSQRAALTTTLLDDLLVELIASIKKYYLFLSACYIAIQGLAFAARTLMIIDKAFILISLYQLSTMAGILINFWVNKHLKEKSKEDGTLSSTINLINIAIKFVVYSIILLLALNNLGIDITALIAGLGVGGVAVALALQNILTDLFSSLTIVLDKPFIVGDFIVVGDLSGTIENIGLKTTRVRSISGEQLIFGNGDLLQSRIRNYKRMTDRRVVQNLTVTYQTDPDLLEKIPSLIEEIVKAQDKTRFDRCHFLRFQDSSLDFELVYWINSPDFKDYADRAEKINLLIFRTFIKNKIDFAYPTRTLYLQKED